jgi:hypothetical protein
LLNTLQKNAADMPLITLLVIGVGCCLVLALAILLSPDRPTPKVHGAPTMVRSVASGLAQIEFISDSDTDED